MSALTWKPSSGDPCAQEAKLSGSSGDISRITTCRNKGTDGSLFQIRPWPEWSEMRDRSWMVSR